MGGEIRFACPVASRCGGCQMAHLPYAEQLRRKRAWVRELLSPFCPVEDIVGMENPFHYRNKTHAVLAGDRSGNVISGVYRMGTHQVVPVDKCLIQNEKADAIIDFCKLKSHGMMTMSAAVKNLFGTIPGTS